MATITSPGLVKPLFGLLYQKPADFERAWQRIESQFGRMDFCSEAFEFVETDYYEEEMGKDLRRRYLSLETLMVPDQLVHYKQLSNLWEEEFSVEGRRTVNIDPGYLGPANLVLASSKHFSHRLYLGRGIYADVTLIYAHGTYQDLPWTYPDYCHHKDVFITIHSLFKKQLNLMRQEETG